jgi:ABC-2 type transport system ATP-binding protein
VPAICLDGVSKRFRLYQERNRSLKATVLERKRSRFTELWALQDVSLSIDTHETVGIIGHNGSGKSTLLKCIARILQPDRGTVHTTGTVASMLELGTGFHPDLSGRENVHVTGLVLGLSRQEIDSRMDQIVEFAGLENFIDTPVRNYSSGMYMRLGFSVAAHVDPDILVIDEVLAVGDEAFQRTCLSKLAEFRNSGKTIVTVSHSMPTLLDICDRIIWLESGEIRAAGPPAAIVDQYRRSSPTGGGSTRTGTGEVRLIEAALTNPTGDRLQHCRTGDCVELRFDVRADQPVDDIHVCLSIRLTNGTLVSGPGTREVGLVTGPFDGRARFRMTINDLTLLPGTYEVDLTLRDSELLHVYDGMTSALSFDVLSGTGGELSGLVTLDPHWRFEVR